MYILVMLLLARTGRFTTVQYLIGLSVFYSPEKWRRGWCLEATVKMSFPDLLCKVDRV